MSKPSVHTLRLYLAVWVVLMLLVALTVGSAYLQLGSFNLVASLLISLAKTALVMSLYMELRREHGTTILFAAAGFLWICFLVAPTVMDAATR